MANTKTRLIIFFAAKDGEALYSQQKLDQRLTVAQIMNSLLPNSIDQSGMIYLSQIPYDYTVEVTTRFNRLDLTDKKSVWSTTDGGSWHCRGGSDEDHPPKKKCNNAKRFSEKALQIAERRRGAKAKEEKLRYTHLNAEFQRTAKRDQKAFFSDQCKEIEESKRMGKTRNLSKKLRDTKGTFHAKMGTMKDRNSMDLNSSRRY